MTRRTTWLAVLALAIPVLAACGARDSAGVSAAVQMTLVPAPEGAAGEHLTVVLTDEENQPITDASVSLEGNMNHAGMAPVFTDEVHDADDGAADGRYRAPFRFTMLGDWIVTVSVQLADGTTAQQDVALTVTSEAVRVK